MTDARDEPGRLGGKTVALVAAFYIGCVAVATYPMVATFGSRLPGFLPLDPLQHLWIMRWYRACLLEGRSPLLCPEIHYPTGAPLGNFSPLLLQAMLYLPLSALFRNDVLCFDLIWMTGLVTTGLGTFWLAWRALGHRGCAALGGMLAMLSAPVLLHAQAHLELVFLGSVPAFLASWLAFVDRPSRGRLAGAAALYVLVGLCAAYYVVFAAFPAALYVAWQALRAARRGEWAWLRSRAAWLAAFAGLVVPALALAFVNQIWALARGYALGQPMEVFEANGAPLWTYVMPGASHRLIRVVPFDAYQVAGFGMTTLERTSYLGVVTLALVYLAAARRVRFPGAGYWWATLAALAVLGCGARWQFGSYSMGLPGGWLKRHCVAFAMIRIPARFNLLVAVVAALVTAASLRDLLARLPNRAWRGAALGGLALAAVLDMSIVPFHTAAIPPTPPCYAWLRRRDPGAAFLEVPQHVAGGSYLSSLCAYWQSYHRGRTSVGYAGQGNHRYDNLVYWNSPFMATSLARRDFLADPDRCVGPAEPARSFGDRFDVAWNVGFLEYVWLYLTANKFDYVILHQWEGSSPEARVYLDRLKELLRGARVYEDAMTAVYARARLAPPRRPVVLCTEGWRPGMVDLRHGRVAGRMARLAVYNPDAEWPLAIALEAATPKSARAVRLVAGGVELARWGVGPGPAQHRLSPPFRLPAGLQELALVSDGEDTPDGPGAAATPWDLAPFSLRVASVGIGQVPRPAAIAGQARTIR
jgi:hypothetical protein